MRKVYTFKKKGMRTFIPPFIDSFPNFKALGAKRQKFLHQRLKGKEERVRLTQRIAKPVQIIYLDHSKKMWPNVPQEKRLQVLYLSSGAWSLHPL
jgi:hypothetical protein